MTSPINPFIYNTFSPPVMEARNWLNNTKLPKDLELMNLSQAAPIDPPTNRNQASDCRCGT